MVSLITSAGYATRQSQSSAIKAIPVNHFPTAHLTAESPVAENNCHFCATRKVCQAQGLGQDNHTPRQTPVFHRRVLQTRKYLFHAGDEMDALYVIKSGSFKTYLNNENGEEYVMGFYMPGEILGADALATRKHVISAIALDTSAVCVLPIKRLENEMAHGSSNWLLKQACQETLRESQMFLMSVRNNASAYARVACFLLKLSRDHKAQGHSGFEFKLDMKRSDIANYLGLTIETVSRVFSRLQKDGILSTEGRLVGIADMVRLTAMTKVATALGKLNA